MDDSSFNFFPQRSSPGLVSRMGPYNIAGVVLKDITLLEWFFICTQPKGNFSIIETLIGSPLRLWKGCKIISNFNTFIGNILATFNLQYKKLSQVC